MSRVLITGATSGLGLALVESFGRAGWQVRATGRSALPAGRVADGEFVQADITQAGTAERLCTDVGLVVHAAALSASWGEAQAFQAVNVQATRALLESAQRAGCTGFVFISSPSIYAALRDRVGITEADAPCGLNNYARSKLEAERLVLATSGSLFHTCAVRPRALVGAGDRVLLPRLAAMARRGWLPSLRGGRALIELTDLRDAAAAIRLAAERIEAVSGEAFNISGGNPVTIGALTRRLADALGTRVRTVPVPLWLARALAARGARETGGPEPALTPYTLATLAFSQTFNLGKARERLGYQPRHDAVATLLRAARDLA